MSSATTSAPRWRSTARSSRTRISKWIEQRRFEGAFDRGLALAGRARVTDDDDLLIGFRERLEGIAGRDAGAVIEPVAKLRQREDLREARPAARANVEH